VQNLSGQWIDAPPIPGTFVVNIGKGEFEYPLPSHDSNIRIAPYHIDLLSALEFVTQGLARATSHRVLSPKGTTPRYSVPFFQNIGLNIRLTDQIVQCPWFVFGTISVLRFS
jgi:hypothetical protein